MVIANDGRLKGLADGYTTTDRYPYSQPLPNGIDYMRNAVKVVIDAYDGDVAAYVSAPDDPIILAGTRLIMRRSSGPAPLASASSQSQTTTLVN